MKTATISELEREELMAQEFPMEDLETVYGGVEMEDSIGVLWEPILSSILGGIPEKILNWEWDRFWGWIKEHKDLIISRLATFPGFIGKYTSAKYASMSDSQRAKLWRDYYNKFH